MEYNSDVLRRQYAVVALFLRHLAYARGLKDATANITEHREFFEVTASAHLAMATAEWCKVFGSEREEVHWKKALGEDAKERDFEEFRSRIRSKTDLSLEEWEAYRKNMLGLRDKFVAHLDLSKPFSEPVPSFESALRVAYAYEGWAKELIRASSDNPIRWEEPALVSQYKQWKAEAFLAASMQRS